MRLGPPLNLDLRTPIAVAPTAFHRLAHPEGEAATAAGAARAGALFVLSTRSSRRIEEVGEAAARHGGRRRFQVYLMRDPDLTAGLVRRAAAAGAQALVLTGDTPVVGRRALEPGGGVISAADFEDNLGRLDDLSRARFVPAAWPTSAGWARSAGACPCWSRGCCAPTTRRPACQPGRPASSCPTTAAGNSTRRCPPRWPCPPCGPPRRARVLVDGGVRSHVLAGLALGAPLVFVGRPVLWALACGGATACRRGWRTSPPGWRT